MSEIEAPKVRAYCAKGDHYPEELMNWPVIGIDEEKGMVKTEVAVLLNNAGKCLNRYANGIMGIPSEVAEAAEEEDTAYCAEHNCDIDWHRDPALHSKRMDYFFQVEITNEQFGGDSPSTLQSARDSLEQAPYDVVAEWLEPVDGAALLDDRTFREFENELDALIALNGGDKQLLELLSTEGETN